MSNVDIWFKAHDDYHNAVNTYNARVKFIREQEKLGHFGEFNAHGEYKIMNEAQRTAFEADNALYYALKK